MHGFDEILREAWRQGVVLAGWSAGMICWFEAGVTDSFGPQLAGMNDGLGLLPGSACPHYDAAGVHFVGAELHAVLASAPGAGAYRVGPDGEEALAARLLSAGAAP